MSDAPSVRRNGRRASWLGALLVSAVTLIPYHGLVRHPGWLLTPCGDVRSQIGLHAANLLRAVSDHEPPWWNPWIFAGIPHWAHPQSWSAYPWSAIFLLVPPANAYTFVFWTHQLLAALGTFLWLRDRRLSVAASLLGGVAMALQGRMLAHTWAGHLNTVSGAAWMPWAFFTLGRALRRGSKRAAAACGAVLTLTFLAGHLQSWFYLSLVLALVGLVEALWPGEDESGERKAANRRARLRLLVLPFLVCALSIGVQLLPILELSRFTIRAGGVGDAESAQLALTAPQLLTLLTPQFFGLPGLSFWGPGSFHELYLYVGLVPLVLIPFGACELWRRGDRFGRALVVAAVLGLVFAAGGPFFQLARRIVPGMRYFRIPTRMLLVTAPVFVLLAASGLDVVVARRRIAFAAAAASAMLACVLLAGSAELGVSAAPSRFLRIVEDATRSGALSPAVAFESLWQMAPSWLAALIAELRVQALLAIAITATLVALGRAVGASAQRLALVLVGLTVLDLSIAAAPLIQLAPAREWTTPSPELEMLAARATSEPPFRVLELGGRLDTPTAIGVGVEKLNAYDPVILDGMMALARLAVPDHPGSTRLTSLPLGKLEISQETDLRLLDLLNVRYVVTDGAVLHPDLAESDAERGQLGTVHVYRYLRAGPRARWVPVARWFPDGADGDAALREALRTSDFDHEVLLSGSEPSTGTGGLADSPRAAAGSVEVRWLARSTNRVALEVEAPSPGYLVLADAWYPGWHARVNGAEVPVQRAQLALRAVRLERPHAVVELFYVPRWLVPGCVMSGAGLLLLVVTACSGGGRYCPR